MTGMSSKHSKNSSTNKGLAPIKRKQTQSQNSQSPSLTATLQAIINRHLEGENNIESDYRTFLKQSKAYPVAYANLAAICINTDRLEEAVALSEKAISLAPGYASAHLNHANALRQLQRLSEAVESFRKVIKLEPNNLEALLQLGNVLKQSGDSSEAIMMFKKFLEHHPKKSSVWLSLGELYITRQEWTEALENLNQALNLDPTNREGHFNRGLALRGQQRQLEQGAKEAFREAIQCSSNELTTCRNLARLLRQRGELDRAAEAWQAALVIAPNDPDSLFGLALLERHRQHPAEALNLLQQLVKNPEVSAAVWFELGIQQASVPNPEAAARSYAEAIQRDPGHAAARCNLAVLQIAKGNFIEAELELRQAIKHSPTLVDAHFNLGIALKGQSKIEEAKEKYIHVLDLNPNYVKASCNLAAIANEQGDPAQALRWLEKAMATAPSMLELYTNKATALMELGRNKEAQDTYRQALAHDPTFDMGWFGLANLLHGSGEHSEALRCYEQVIALKPTHLEAKANRGIQLLRLGRHDQALATLQEVASLAPQWPAGHYQLANVLLEMGNFEAALQCCDDALALNPNSPEAHSNRGVALQNLGRMEEAEASYRQAVQTNPKFADAYYNLGVLCKEQGRFQEAVQFYRQAIAIRPTYANALTNLVYLLSFSQIESQENILAATTDWVRQLCTPRLEPFRQRNIELDRPLRLGVISAEIGNHAVSYFLKSYLRHYDRSLTNIHLFPTINRAESEAQALFELVEGVTPLANVEHERARALVLEQNIDLLIDTTAHMRGNRLELLAERCAPVQAHWIGFHGSTGVPAVDWFIGDHEVTPGHFAHHFSERLWRLPRLWVCYTPPTDAPEPEPRADDAPVTIGTFNNLLKVGEQSLALFAAVLRAVPKATLVIKDRRCHDPYMRRTVLERLSAHGIATERIQLIERVADWKAHMRLYNTLDLALDTTPLNSGTTGFDALFMGTPLVALRGDWMGGRLTSAMLKALDCHAWVAESPDQFVTIVRDLLSDRGHLRRSRRDLRQRVLASHLCDGPGLAAMMDREFRLMAELHNSERAISQPA
jgi:predicted O-linked N-acetylglucosamine transferase (SPINDLY family)